MGQLKAMPILLLLLLLCLKAARSFWFDVSGPPRAPTELRGMRVGMLGVGNRLPVRYLPVGAPQQQQSVVTAQGVVCDPVFTSTLIDVRITPVRIICKIHEQAANCCVVFR